MLLIFCHVTRRLQKLLFHNKNKYSFRLSCFYCIYARKNIYDMQNKIWSLFLIKDVKKWMPRTQFRMHRKFSLCFPFSFFTRVFPTFVKTIEIFFLLLLLVVECGSWKQEYHSFQKHAPTFTRITIFCSRFCCCDKRFSVYFLLIYSSFSFYHYSIFSFSYLFPYLNVLWIYLHSQYLWYNRISRAMCFIMFLLVFIMVDIHLLL